MYITVTIPTIRTVVMPVEGVDTREDQIAALRVLSAGNTLIMVLLGGILALQVRPEWNSGCFFPFYFLFFIYFTREQQGGQEWARRLELKELAKIAAEEAKAKEADKKKQ